MQTMIYSLGLVSDPQQTIKRLLTDTPCCVTFDFDYQQSWLEFQPVIRLSALCLLNDPDTRCVVIPQGNLSLSEGGPIRVFEAAAQRLALNSVSLNEAWLLETIRIDKPWGAEVWYTGIEERGICTVNGMPLPWLIALCPDSILGACPDPNPILLKILDPFSNEDLGDLYFELHDLKTEVYIVTHVDETAWSDGRGQIRYGFNQTMVTEFESVDAFKSAYLGAVTDYEQVRNEIDRLLDKKKSNNGIALSDPVQPEQLKEWMSSLPKSLLQQEAKLKQTMYAFTELRSICVGDVIQVKPHLPHSLQHGVRVVEFQTAHYERHILSFTQKVLTQNHWDTEPALDNAIIEIPEEPALTTVFTAEGCIVECVAEFPQFTAFRIRLQKNASYVHLAKSYSLAMLVTGAASVSDHSLTPEQALFLPASSADVTIKTTNETAVLLLAVPASPPSQER